VNALVVGAGSVGRVIARHLHLSGKTVTILSRGKQVRSISRGMVFYELNRRNARSRPIRSPGFDIVTRASQLDGESWDQIYMCVPSNALSSELLDWIQTYGGDATIIRLQPGLRDYTPYASHFNQTQVVVGMLRFISYQAPLVGEKIDEPGTAYWFPPLMPSLFGGCGARLKAVVDTLNAGGLPARAHADIETLLGYILAIEAPLTAGHECAGWSIRGFRRSRWLKVASGAIREAVDVVSVARRTNSPAITGLLKPTILQLALFLLPKGRKVPLEPYLEHHFTKLRTQSRQHLDDYLRVGMEYGMSTPCLRELKNGLDSIIIAP